jgi:TPR repeat protein
MMQLASNEGHAHFIYGDREEGYKAFLLRAARDGHAPGMYQYALECDDPQERLQWMRRAAASGHVGAIASLETPSESRVVACPRGPRKLSGTSRFAHWLRWPILRVLPL